MIHRFATFETAALFVTLKRDQGYFAEVLHANAGHLWGPVASMGFSVITSDLAAEEGEEVPELQLVIPSLPRELGTIVVSVVCATFAVLLLMIVRQLLLSLAASPVTWLIAAIYLTVCLGLMLVFFCVLGWFLSEATRIYRDPEHRLHGLVRFLHSGLAALLIFWSSEVLGALIFLNTLKAIILYWLTGLGGAR